MEICNLWLTGHLCSHHYCSGEPTHLPLPYSSTQDTSQRYCQKWHNKSPWMSNVWRLRLPTHCRQFTPCSSSDLHLRLHACVCVCVCLHVSACLCSPVALAYVHICMRASVCICICASAYRTLNIQTRSDANGSLRLDTSFVQGLSGCTTV